MLTKAIILGKELNSNQYTIRIPLLETSASKEVYKTKATLCADDGVLNPFNIGDVVYVSFEDDLYENPVILGKLSLEGLMNKEREPSNVSYLMNSLQVTTKAELPIDTKIGDIKYEELSKTLRRVDDLDTTLKQLPAKDVAFDKTVKNKLDADNVQEAIDELSDVDPVNDGKLTIQLNGSKINDFTANSATDKTVNIQALPNYNLKLNYVSGGGTQPNKFLSINYSAYTSESAAYFKMSAASCHGNGQSYQFLEDILIGCSVTGVVTCKVFKYCQQNAASPYASYKYGDVFYVKDENNKVVDFYILCGQYAASYYTPFIKIGNTTTSGITQYIGTPTKYSTGTRVWADGNSAVVAVQDSYSTTSEIPVGTWTNGKIIYKKTFNFTSAISPNQYVEIGDLGFAVDEVVKIEKGMRNSSSPYWFVDTYINPFFIRVTQAGKVEIYSKDESWSSPNLTVTVYYTKN